MVQRKDEILDAAVQLFQQHGFHATSIEDITRACGISKGAFYKHFDSKESMILKLLKRYYEDIFREADRFSEEMQASPLVNLQNKLTIELEKSFEYRSFFYVLMTEFPPHEKGAIPESLNRIKQTHHDWHKQALLEAFGQKPRPYVNDLAVMMEGILHSYLMRISWKELIVPLERLAGLIVACLKAIVENDDGIFQLIPDNITTQASKETIQKTMKQDLKEVWSEITEELAAEQDYQALDMLLEEIEQEEPRMFLVDALIGQLYRRPHLKKQLTSVVTTWELWKGDLK